MEPQTYIVIRFLKFLFYYQISRDENIRESSTGFHEALNGLHILRKEGRNILAPEKVKLLDLCIDKWSARIPFANDLTASNKYDYIQLYFKIPFIVRMNRSISMVIGDLSRTYKLRHFSAEEISHGYIRWPLRSQRKLQRVAEYLKTPNLSCPLESRKN